MMTQHKGFSILEMIISIMISAMLMTAALTIYQQISKGAQTVQRITHLDTQIMVLHNRLATDLQGLLPLWFTVEHYENLKKGAEGQSEKNEPTGSKKRNNFLYAQSNNNQFEILTFVTTNALQIYSDKPQLRTVRVVYVLQKDPDDSSTFKLMRKEDDTIAGDFDLEKLKSGSFYTIADKITTCTIEYGFMPPTKKGEESEQNKQFKFVSQWGQHQEKQKEDEEKPYMPDIIKLTLKMQYLPSQDAKAYELYCSIPASHATAIKSFAQLRQEKEQQAKQAKTPAPKEGATPAPEKKEPSENIISSGVANGSVPENSETTPQVVTAGVLT